MDFTRKGNKWIAFHLGSFIQSNGKDATNNALKELCLQFKDGRFRELQSTIDVDRESHRIIVRRWLDQVILEEFTFSSISNVQSHKSVQGHGYLSNLLSFTTPTKAVVGNTEATEIHVFQLESYNMVNYLASDVRSAVEETYSHSKNIPIKVLPSGENDKIGTKTDFETIYKNEEITSKTERNLLLLNYCFDDIEVFLQHLKDQEEAQKKLKASKNKATDRLLEGQAKPSTQSAYISCIKKIKFSLNLLSKLQGKIKNPDSKELSHLLIENLVRIGQAYSIYHNGKLSKIKEPLLTEETIKMLIGCLSKTLNRQLSSWGDFWIKPREKFNGYTEVYYPDFFNGHQIDLEHLEKDGLITEIPSKAQNLSFHSNLQIKETIMSNRNPMLQYKMQSTSFDQVDSTENAMLNSSNSSGNNKLENLTQRQEDFCRSITLRNGKLYKVTNPFTASKEEELSISEGEIIEVLEERHDRNWWLCTNMHGDRGYAPKTIIEPFHYFDRSISPVSGTSPISNNGLSNSNTNNSTAIKNPTSPAVLQKPNIASGGKKSIDINPNEVKTIQEELKIKLNTVQQNQSNFGNAASRASFARPGPVVSRKHGQLSINQDSTHEDVVKWLKFKNFNQNDIDILKEFNGQKIFLLSREQMDRLLGLDTAGRLYSLVKVQKSLSGFGTMSKRELEEILMRRKEKVDFVEMF